MRQMARPQDLPPSHYAWHEPRSSFPLYADRTPLTVSTLLNSPSDGSTTTLTTASVPRKTSAFTTDGTPLSLTSLLNSPSDNTTTKYDDTSSPSASAPTPASVPRGKASASPLDCTAASSGKGGTPKVQPKSQQGHGECATSEAQGRTQGHGQRSTHGQAQGGTQGHALFEWHTTTSPSTSARERPSNRNSTNSGSSSNSKAGTLGMGLCVDILEDEEVPSPSSLLPHQLVYHPQHEASCASARSCVSDGDMHVGPPSFEHASSSASAPPSSSAPPLGPGLTRTSTVPAYDFAPNEEQADGMPTDLCGAVEATCLNFEGVQRLCRERDDEGDVLLSLEIKPFKLFRRQHQNKTEEVVYSLTFSSNPRNPMLPGQDTNCLSPAQAPEPPVGPIFCEEESGASGRMLVSLGSDVAARFAAYGEWTGE